MPESVFTHTMPAPFAGGACRVVGVFEAGALAEAAVAPLSAASACFGVVFFFEGAVPESGAECAAEAPASAFSLFLSFLAALVSVWSSSPVGCAAACAQAEALPAPSRKAPNKATCILLIISILKLSPSCVAADLPRWNGRMISGNGRGSQEGRKTMGCDCAVGKYECSSFNREL